MKEESQGMKICTTAARVKDGGERSLLNALQAKGWTSNMLRDLSSRTSDHHSRLRCFVVLVTSIGNEYFVQLKSRCSWGWEGRIVREG